MNEPGHETGTGTQPSSSEAPAQPADEGSVVADLKDRLLRARADLDNLRKRHAADLRWAREAERGRAAATLLPVLDNLELALAHAEADPGAIVQGVLATRDQAVQILAGLGYPRDDEVDIPFDPNRHEVVAVVEDEQAEPNTVTRVVRPGYGAAGHELRPAAVVVSRPRELSPGGD